MTVDRRSLLKGAAGAALVAVTPWKRVARAVDPFAVGTVILVPGMDDTYYVVARRDGEHGMAVIELGK